jgi:hypothetical protein
VGTLQNKVKIYKIIDVVYIYTLARMEARPFAPVAIRVDTSLFILDIRVGAGD